MMDKDIFVNGRLEHLVSLLRANGFQVGTNDEVEFTAIIDRFGDLPATHVCHYLAPVICHSPEEQASFYRIFADWQHRENDVFLAGRKALRKRRVSLIAWSVAILIFGFCAYFILRYYHHSLRKPVPAICASQNIIQVGDTVSFFVCNNSAVSSSQKIQWYFDRSVKQVEGDTVKYHFSAPGAVLVKLVSAPGDTVHRSFKIYPSSADLEITPEMVDSGRNVVVKAPKGLSEAHHALWLFSANGITDTLKSKGDSIRYISPNTGEIEVTLTDPKLPYPLAYGNYNVTRSEPVYNLSAIPEGNKESVNYTIHEVFVILFSLMLGTLLYYLLMKAAEPIADRLIRTISADTGGLEKPAALPFLNKDTLVYPENNLIRVFSELQRRFAGDDKRLDLERTIYKTVNSHGLVTPVYVDNPHYITYLFLVDRNGSYDQQAYLFNYLLKNFTAENIDLAAYFFGSDPLVMTDGVTGQNYALSDLLIFHESAVLVVIGDGHKFIDRAFPVIRSDLEKIFKRWETRILITPVAIMDWELEENQILSALFKLLPADLEGWLRIGQLITESEDWTTIRRGLQQQARDIDFRSIEELAAYLADEDLVQWVCGLAIYHKIRWEFLVAAGKAILNSRSAGYKLNYTNLLKIARIDWINKGVFPAEIRLALLKRLSVPAELVVRKAMLSLSSEVSHLVSEQSFIYAEKEAQEIIDSFIIYANAPENNPELRLSAARFSGLWLSGNISDSVLKTYLSPIDSAWETPISVVYGDKMLPELNKLVGEIAYRREKWWKWPRPIIGFVFSLLVFLLVQLTIITYSSTFAGGWLHKLLPVVAAEHAKTAVISVILDNSSCAAKFSADKTEKIKLSVGNSIYSQQTKLSGPGDSVVRFANVLLPADIDQRVSISLSDRSGITLVANQLSLNDRYRLQLSGPGCIQNGRYVYIQYDDHTDPAIAERLRQCLLSDGYRTDPVEKRSFNRNDVVRYLTPAMKPAADSLARAVSVCLNRAIGTAYIPTPNSADTTKSFKKVLEVWLNDNQDCQLVKLETISSVKQGGVYYNTDMSRSISFEKDYVSFNYSRNSGGAWPHIDQVKNCSGNYTLYLNSNDGRKDSIQFFAGSYPGSLQVFYAPKFSPGALKLFMDPNAVKIASLDKVAPEGDWQTSGNRISFSNGQFFLDGTAYTTGVIYSDPANHSLLFTAKNADNSRYFIVSLRLNTGNSYIGIQAGKVGSFNRLTVADALIGNAKYYRMSPRKTVVLIKGNSYGGGIIFLLDSAGRHGLVCSPADLGDMSDWAGAKKLCAAYYNGNSKGWRLPTKGELEKLYEARNLIGNLSTGCTNNNFNQCSYWSSTEINATMVWVQYFTTGAPWNNYTKVSLARVRAVRSF